MERSRTTRIITVALTITVSFFSLLAIILIAARFGFSPAAFHDPAKVFDPTTLITSLFVLILPIVLSLISQRLLLRRTIEDLGLVQTANLGRAFLNGCAAGLLLKTISTFSAFVASSEAQISSAVTGLYLASWGPYFAWFLLALLLNSLNEELLFRAFPIRNLEEDVSNPTILVWLTAAAFSIMHFVIEPPDMYHFLYRLAFGLVAGQLFLNTRSLWEIVGLHSGWNFVALAVNDSEWRTGCLISLTGLRPHSEIVANAAVLGVAFCFLLFDSRHVRASGKVTATNLSERPTEVLR